MPVAIVFISGVFAHAALPAWPTLYLIALGACVIAALILFNRPIFCAPCLLAGIFLAALLLAQWRLLYFADNHIARFTTPSPRLVELELRVVEPPRVIAPAQAERRFVPAKQFTMAEVLRIRTTSGRRGWQPASGRISVTILHPHNGLAIAQTIRAVGLLERPPVASNPGQFDFAEYYRHQRVLASLLIPKAYHIEILHEQRTPVLAALRGRAREALAAGFPNKHGLDFAVLQALLLGDRTPETTEVAEQFAQSGTAHLLAISGLHVAVVAFFIYLTCRLLCCRPRISVCCALTAVMLYGLVAHASPSVIRATLLCLSAGTALLLKRKTDGLQLLALGALAMLIYQPLDLYTAAFQLSFGAVAGLLLFSRRTAAFFASLRASPDPPPQLAQGVWLKLWRWLRHHLASLAVAALVAWLVSLPLIAFHFEQLNPFAILASILLAPLVFIAIIGGLLKIVLCLLIPAGAPMFAWLAALPIAAMRHGVAFFAHFPKADLAFPRPSLWLIAIYYLLLSLPVTAPLLVRQLRRKPRESADEQAKPTRFVVYCRRLVQLSPAAAFSLACLAAALAHSSIGGSAQITILSVGAGSAAVVELPSGKTIIVDAGSSTYSDIFRTAIAPFLRHRGIRQVAAIYISHPNYDHFSAVTELAETFDAPVFITPYFQAATSHNASAEALLDDLDALHDSAQLRTQLPPDTLEERASFEMLWPPPGRRLDNDNESSQVIRLTVNGRSILFTGDIQTLAETALLQDAEKLHCDVLVAPHHGSSEQTTPAFLAAVHPQYIVSSNDNSLSQKQRAFDRMATGIPLYRTDRCGAITVTIDAQSRIQVTTFLSAPAGR
ncbi:MAG TPA: DNA internalization-related competence protein ComEC/Rec2 [Tepidisphaeraceae bacterium]